MKLNNQPRHYYVCKVCDTANVFQPWVLRKERLVRCPHCRHLNKVPYISNASQVWVTLLFAVIFLLLTSMIWTWFLKGQNFWMY